jgi:hypothetical protein
MTRKERLRYDCHSHMERYFDLGQESFEGFASQCGIPWHRGLAANLDIGNNVAN